MVRMDHRLHGPGHTAGNNGGVSLNHPYGDHMKRFATVFVALGLATAGSVAFAEQAKDSLNRQAAKPQPVKMTDAQMDNVAGGALLTVVALDVVDVQNVANNLSIDVAVPVNAAVAANVLGSGALAVPTQTGRIRQ